MKKYVTTKGKEYANEVNASGEFEWMQRLSRDVKTPWDDQAKKLADDYLSERERILQGID